MDKNVSIYEISAPEEWDGKTLAALDVRRKYQLNIIAVRRDDQLTIPMADTVLREDDHMLIIGSLKDIRKCFKL